MDFNTSITQAVAKTMEHLSDFVFMRNLTLARRASYLTHLKSGVKADTLSAFRTAPLQIVTLFPDSVVKCAEEDIANFENMEQSSRSKQNVITLTKGQIERPTRDQRIWLGKTLVTKIRARNPRVGHHIPLPDQPRASSGTNDNYCADKLQERLLARSKGPARTLNIPTPQTQVVNFSVITYGLFAKGHSQWKDISPFIVNCCKQRKLKYVRDVSYVDQLSNL